MDFAEWFLSQLSERQWSQAEMIRRAAERGYLLKSSHLSRILNREQEAGVDYVIAIADSLGVSREAAFRARGWLLDQVGNAEMDTISDEVIAIVKGIESLSLASKVTALRLIGAVIDTLKTNK